MLVIGLQDKPALFLPLEYRAAGEKDPVAIRYSLGWTVVGPVGGKKDDSESTLSKEVEQERMNEDLKHQLEVCPSLEDKKVLQIMEETLKVVDGHFQVALPWRNNPPYLPNNKVVAERRGFLLKKLLLRDDDLLRKYQTTMIIWKRATPKRSLGSS